MNSKLTLGHLFADDMQDQVHGPASAQLILTSHIQGNYSNAYECLQMDLKSQLYQNSTHLVWYPNNSTNMTFCFLLKTSPVCILCLCTRCHHTACRDLLSFSEQIPDLTSSSFFQLWCLRAIQRSVSSPTVTSIVHAFICFRIDYCNALPIGLPP